MKFKNRLFSFLSYPAFFLCLLPVAIFTFKHPAYNFDMLGYMALVIRIDMHDLDKVHDMTYEKARQEIPGEEYRKLTEALPFRKEMAVDASKFEKILPIYSVKPLYIGLCWLFYRTGFSLVSSTYITSIASYLIIGLFLFFWLAKYLQHAVAFLSALLIMYSMFAVAIAGHSTPDCLSALFLFIAMYFILEKQNVTGMFFFFLLSIFARVDNVISCFFVITFLTFSRQWKMIGLRRYLLMIAILVIAYICAIFPVTQFGWSIFYYPQYAKHIDFSRDFDQAITFSSYITLVYTKLVTAMVSTQFTFFLFLCLLTFGNPFSSWRKLTFDQSFLLLLLLIIFSRFLLLPDLSDRFYLGFYLVFIILLVRKLQPRILAPHHNNDKGLT
jgi:hypothetical protein